jgi:hypothetical protein
MFFNYLNRAYKSYYSYCSSAINKLFPPKIPIPKQQVPILNDVLNHTLFHFIAMRDQVSLAKSALQFFRLPRFNNKFKQYSLLVPQFLKSVVEGRQEDARENLIKFPDVALVKGDVTDCSNRRFKNISAIQYAAWAYDMHMLKMLLAKIPPGEKAFALQQLDELEINKTKYGAHYDFSSIIVALRTCCENMDWSSQQRRDFWVKIVGGAQCLMPVHVAQEYCRADRSFVPTPSFKNDDLPRQFGSYQSREMSAFDCWFPIKLNPLKWNLGINFAYSRMSLNKVFGSVSPVGRIVGEDLAAMCALRDARTLEYAEIVQNLRNEIKFFANYNHVP